MAWQEAGFQQRNRKNAGDSVWRGEVWWPPVGTCLLTERQASFRFYGLGDHMDNKYQYSEEVIKNIDTCSKIVGQYESEQFHQDTFCELTDLKLESPIEHIFYTSLKTIRTINYLGFHSLDNMVRGMDILPQHPIGKYRVDFLCVWYGHRLINASEAEKLGKQVVIECDSQEWHERTERERRYEKRRDRELSRLGYHTFRFTGKEIKDNSFNAAMEVCSFLTGDSLDDLSEPLRVFSR